MDSDDYTTDEGNKRRREEGEDDQAFGRSAKIIRTPTKINKKNDEKLDLIIGMMKDLKLETQQIRRELEDYREEISSIKKENEVLRQENIEIKTENKGIKEELGQLRNKMEWIEKEKRRNNVVVMGLEVNYENGKTIKENMETMLKEELQVEVQVKTANKMGDKICLLELESEEDKGKIMRNKHKLRTKKDHKIYINDDMTESERKKAKEIRKKASEERSQGKMVKIGYNTVNNGTNEWRWNKIKGVLELTLPKNQ